MFVTVVAVVLVAVLVLLAAQLAAEQGGTGREDEQPARSGQPRIDPVRRPRRRGADAERKAEHAGRVRRRHGQTEPDGIADRTAVADEVCGHHRLAVPGGQCMHRAESDRGEHCEQGERDRRRVPRQQSRVPPRRRVGGQRHCGGRGGAVQLELARGGTGQVASLSRSGGVGFAGLIDGRQHSLEDST